MDADEHESRRPDDEPACHSWWGLLGFKFKELNLLQQWTLMASVIGAAWLLMSVLAGLPPLRTVWEQRLGDIASQPAAEPVDEARLPHSDKLAEQEGKATRQPAVQLEELGEIKSEVESKSSPPPIQKSVVCEVIVPCSPDEDCDYLASQPTAILARLENLTGIQATALSEELFVGKRMRIKGAVSGVYAAITADGQPSARVVLRSKQVILRYTVRGSELDEAMTLSNGDHVIIDGLVRYVYEPYVDFEDAFLQATP